jgi:hypothetical protein
MHPTATRLFAPNADEGTIAGNAEAVAAATRPVLRKSRRVREFPERPLLIDLSTLNMLDQPSFGNAFLATGFAGIFTDRC